MRNNFYIDFILNNTPRIITQIDRDFDSITFGSCDRNYWHLKIRDFSSAILQQSALTLAVLHKKNFPGNIYYNNKNILTWVKGILNYWRKIQLNDGSFNEYYPNEHAFPPTAFSLFTVAETYKRLNLNDRNLLESMNKASKFLIKNYESQAYNQEIASITGLYSYYSIKKESWILKGLNEKLDRVLMAQSKEGWFPEYGGADLGYLSVSFDMLAEYYWLSKDEKVKKPLEKLLKFISYFCHPDRTYGGEYGSRDTIYLLPNGLETMIRMGSTTAISVKQHIFNNQAHKNYHNSIDDRYFSHYVLHSYARAIEKEIVTKKIKKQDIPLLPCQTEHLKLFNKAGLLTFKRRDIYGIISLKKGGVIKLFKGDKEIFSDYGYRYLKNNSIALTNWLDNSYNFNLENLYQIEIKGYFNLIKQQTSSPLKHFLLRTLSVIIGKSLIKILKNKLIFINSHTSTYFVRNIKIEDNKIIINDEIYPKKTIKKLHSSPIYSLRHVASGKFFHASELLKLPLVELEKVSRPILIRRILNLNNEKIDLSYEKLQ